MQSRRFDVHEWKTITATHFGFSAKICVKHFRTRSIVPIRDASLLVTGAANGQPSSSAHMHIACMYIRM